MAGKKFSGKHSTVIDASEEVVKFLVRHDGVSKISLGMIRSCKAGSGQKNIKIKDTESGFELIIRGNMYVQNIFVYLKNAGLERDEIARQIEKLFD